MVVHSIGTDPALLKSTTVFAGRGLSYYRFWGRASSASMPNMYCELLIDDPRNASHHSRTLDYRTVGPDRQPLSTM